MDYRNHFTNRAIKAIEFAQYAARDLAQDYIGTEHILLACCTSAKVWLPRPWVLWA